jgi:16S rRNA G527 N7-methylase RsmG
MNKGNDQLIDKQQKRITFLKQVKEGQYAEVEESSIAYSRLNQVGENEEIYIEEYLYSVN